MANFSIVNVKATEVLDSRANPTLRVDVELENGKVGVGYAPSGASTGSKEALELRDGDKKRYLGKGVLKAVKNVDAVIFHALYGKNAADLAMIDDTLIELDGTENKGKLGANATLATSIACANAAANAMGIPLYRYLGGVNANRMPMPMMNVLNGGAHADNGIDVQEFMLVPVGAKSFKESVKTCVEVYHALKGLLKTKGLTTSVGDEGGFAPELSSAEEGIELILQAVRAAGYKEEKDIMLALDMAASEWKDSERGKGFYKLPKSGTTFVTSDLISYIRSLVTKYPIFSVEDGLDEEDDTGWQALTETLGSACKLVGDDLFVTNNARLRFGIENGEANAVLVKPNQIGTLSETLTAVQTAKRAGYTTILSHRSGETEDTTVADLAVALNAGFIKAGAPCRGERVAKYNRLLKIEQELGKNAVFINDAP